MVGIPHQATILNIKLMYVPPMVNNIMIYTPKKVSDLITTSNMGQVEFTYVIV